MSKVTAVVAALLLVAGRASASTRMRQMQDEEAMEQDCPKHFIDGENGRCYRYIQLKHSGLEHAVYKCLGQKAAVATPVDRYDAELVHDLCQARACWLGYVRPGLSEGYQDIYTHDILKSPLDVSMKAWPEAGQNPAQAEQAEQLSERRCLVNLGSPAELDRPEVARWVTVDCRDFGTASARDLSDYRAKHSLGVVCSIVKDDAPFEEEPRAVLNYFQGIWHHEEGGEKLARDRREFQCEGSWHLIGSECYKVVKLGWDSPSMNDAFAACKALDNDAQLAAPSSSQQNDAAFQACRGHACWLGFRYRSRQAGFRNVNADLPMTFHEWKENEPIVSREGATCVVTSANPREDGNVWETSSCRWRPGLEDAANNGPPHAICVVKARPQNRHAALINDQEIHAQSRIIIGIVAGSVAASIIIGAAVVMRLLDKHRILAQGERKVDAEVESPVPSPFSSPPRFASGLRMLDKEYRRRQRGSVDDMQIT